MTQPTTHQYYRNPYEVKLATTKQYDYLLKLVREHLYSDVPLEQQITILEECRDGKRTPMTVKAASDMIEAVLKTPRRDRVEVLAHEAVFMPDGFYEADGRIYKLLTSINGRRYVKVLNDRGKFEYARGGAGTLYSSGTQLDLDRAKELGKLYGRCIICGATLTAEGSIEAGIGPICATRL